jgi:2-iminobutanoate/2-iminopropanoate deaminase
MRRGLIRWGVTPLSALLLVSCGGGSPATPIPTAARELVNPGELYADASRYGDLVFTAGHLPLNVPGGAFERQVEDVLDNLEATLEAAGAGFDTLLQANVYLADFDDWETFNTIWQTRIAQHGLPPRTTIEAGRLCCEEFRIEIAVIAHVRVPSTSP